MSYGLKLRTFGLSSLGNRTLRCDLIALCSFCRRGSAEGGADLFSLVTNDTMCGTTQNCIQGGSNDIRKKICTVRVVKHWNKLLKRGG